MGDTGHDGPLVLVGVECGDGENRVATGSDLRLMALVVLGLMGVMLVRVLLLLKGVVMLLLLLLLLLVGVLLCWSALVGLVVDLRINVDLLMSGLRSEG